MKRTTLRWIALGTVVALGTGVAAVSVAKDGWRGHGRHGGYEKGWHGHGHHGGRGRMMHMLEYLDANEDGALGRDEAQGVIEAKLAEFDADGDGTINLQEFEAAWIDFTRPRMVDGFQKLDADGSGQITLEELTKPIDRIYRRADRNEDGVLDKNDRRRGRGWGRGRGGPRDEQGEEN